MSKKPYIKIVYPDASQIAMLLTEAMVCRASGKRVVETESAEREHVGQDLFAGTLCCVTETSVELTLNLAPEAMDFALATLIAKNLTQSERNKAMAASDSLELDALFTPCAQAAQAPGQALDGESSADVPSAEREAATQSGKRHIDLENIIHGALEDHKISAEYNEKLSFAEDLARRIRLHEKIKTQSGEQEKQIEIWKLSEKKLRDILTDMIVSMDEGTETAEAIDTAVYEIIKKSESPVKLAEPWVAQKIAAVLQAARCNKKSKALDPFARDLIADLEAKNQEDEYYISISVLVELIKTMAQTKSNDPFALYSVFRGEIEPGLLNDIETETEDKK